MISNLLLIGASGQNRGKTHLTCSLIERFRERGITALKISSLLEEEREYHPGEYILGDFSKGFILTEEKSTGSKDSQKMLAAGAVKSYFLRANEDALEEGWKAFYSFLKEDDFIICEGGRLSLVVKPALFLMILTTEELSGEREIKKKSSLKQIQLADLLIETRNQRFNFNIDKISIQNKRWQLND